jgi:hypothetical protein
MATAKGKSEQAYQMGQFSKKMCAEI